MGKEEIISRFNRVLDEVISEGDRESMEVARGMFRKSIVMLADTDTKRANEFVECFEGNLKYYNYLTENEAVKILESFINQDGSRGAKWKDAESFFSLLQSMGCPIESEPHFNKYALFVTANKFASDHGNVIAKWTGDDREKFIEACYELAVTQLEDRDKLYWVRWYFGLN